MNLLNDDRVTLQNCRTEAWRSKVVDMGGRQGLTAEMSKELSKSMRYS